MSVYDVLVELARRERDLIDGCLWDDLLDLQARRGSLVESLPARPPAEARAALETASALGASNEVALRAALEVAGRELSHLGRGRRALASYAGAGGAGESRFA
ncbi:MAG: hypothetical protein R3C15_23350 [Thermoleophilia bacterium]